MPSSFMRRRIWRRNAEHIWSTVVIGVRGQESGVSTQESGGRGQESGVRSQGSGGGGELADEDV